MREGAQRWQAPEPIAPIKRIRRRFPYGIALLLLVAAYLVAIFVLVPLMLTGRLG